MPEVDVYGTAGPHTIIRQHIDYGHWYCRNKLTLKEYLTLVYTNVVGGGGCGISEVSLLPKLRHRLGCAKVLTLVNVSSAGYPQLAVHRLHESHCGQFYDQPQVAKAFCHLCCGLSQ